MGEYGLYHKQTCAPEGAPEEKYGPNPTISDFRYGIFGGGVGGGGVSWDSIGLRPCNTKFMGIVSYGFTDP